MRTMILEKEKIHCGTLLLINAQNPLVSQHMSDLTFMDARFPDILIKREAVNMLQLILEEIKAYNQIVPVSGYRSFKEQTEIYQNSLKDNGEVFTRKFVALPNHSEHQTGLAIDLGLNQKNIDFICPDFPYEGICDEFRKTAPAYGFIQRYTKEKENITGISQEPWHFRYVGYPHSKIMEELGLSLEEYIEFMKEYREDCRFVYGAAYGRKTEIYYVPARGEETYLSLPERCIYQISGNNTDGFIVTVWRKTNDEK